MQRVLLIMLFAMLPAPSSAQIATDRDAVLKVVQIFFDTMTARCGRFDLIKTSEGEWKIAGGVFTMEAKCEPSPLGPLKP